MPSSESASVDATALSDDVAPVGLAAVCESSRFLASPRKRPSLDARLIDLKKEWAALPETIEQPPVLARRPSLLGNRDPPASERALALEMVGGVVRYVLSAPVGENLLSLKTKLRRIYPDFGFVTELVTQDALDARLGAQAWIGPTPVKKKPFVAKTMVVPRRRRLPVDLSASFGHRWRETNRAPAQSSASTTPMKAIGKPRRIPKASNIAASATETQQVPVVTILSRRTRAGRSVRGSLTRSS